MPTPGHTPGHMGVAFTSGQEMAIYVGDLVHHPLQIEHPEWSRVRAENAYQVVREDFNWDKIARMTADVYARAHAAWEQDSWGKELVSQAE